MVECVRGDWSKRFAVRQLNPSPAQSCLVLDCESELVLMVICFKVFKDNCSCYQSQWKPLCVYKSLLSELDASLREKTFQVYLKNYVNTTMTYCRNVLGFLKAFLSSGCSSLPPAMWGCVFVKMITEMTFLPCSTGSMSPCFLEWEGSVCLP